MKLSEIRKITQNLPSSHYYDYHLHTLEYLRSQGLDPDNLYQELEMELPYAQTHRDVSYSNANVQFHSHAFFELVYCRSASNTEYLVGAERYRVQQGDIIFVPPGTGHRPILPEIMAEPYVRDVLWINEEFLRAVTQDMTQEEQEAFSIPALLRTRGTRWEYLGDLFRSGVLEMEAAGIGWQTLVLANTLTILTHLRRAKSDLNARPMRAEKPELLDQVLAYVEQHLSDKITLADVARHFFISESTITQTFRKKMGVSFYRCVTQRRLMSAKALIERGLPLENVAEQVGFSDYSSFFRAFKQEYGISPRQYRKMHGDAK